MNKRILIIGGVAGGAGTAARLRRNDETAEIIMLERGSYISYANCGLPYYVGGVIKEQEELTLQTPESFWGPRFRIDVRVRAGSNCDQSRRENRHCPHTGQRVRSIRKPMTNCSSHPAQSRRFLRFPASAVSVFSRCAPWRIPSALGTL